MFTQTVNKMWLLNKLHENRAKHRDLYNKAFDAYKLKMVTDLEKALEEARKGRHPNLRMVAWEAPQDHTDDYDAIIGLLEVSNETDIEIDESAFRQYVLDNWSWKQQFTATNTLYGVSG